MISDPFYKEIVDRLESKEVFDGVRFEACVCELLRQEFPTLVPISGGQDGGMDGAIADGEGEPYPLVCTIQKDVIGNLTKSLDRYVQEGGNRRKVVLATSQSLTPRRIDNLYERARTRDFTLVQVYEQKAITSLLYRAPVSCKELLRLTGHPPALSVLPEGLQRPLVNVTLRGRDTDIAWLLDNSGDRVLTGEPGSGKTYLLHRLATDGWGLFLATHDEARISNAIREQQPAVIIVDDAHYRPERLDRLRVLRKQVAHSFDILATTWPNEKEGVQTRLSVPDSRTRTLELLSRREIIEVYEEIGVTCQEFKAQSEEVLGQLVDQASNRPGLAVTLATLWKEGNPRSFLHGKVIQREWIQALKRLLGRDESTLLAVLSLAGRDGMKAALASQALAWDSDKTRRRIIALAGAGVLHDRGDHHWAVEPQILRTGLLLSVFFDSTSPCLDYREYIKHVPSLASAVFELIAAALRGAPLQHQELQEHLAPIESNPWRRIDPGKSAWIAFAQMDQQAAIWAIENYPGNPSEILAAAIDQDPDLAIRKLLEQASLERNSPGLRPGKPLRTVKDWLHEITEPMALTIDRRQQVVEIARTWADTEEQKLIAFRVACWALSPRQRSIIDQADQKSIAIRSGILPARLLKEMEQVGACVLELLCETGLPSWPDLQEGLWGWVFPHAIAAHRKPSEEERVQARAFAESFMEALVPLAAPRPGTSSALTRLAARASITLPLELDPIFEALYPENDPQDLVRLHKEEELERLQLLATKLAPKPPRQRANVLRFYAQEAKSIGHSFPDNTPKLREELARIDSEVAAESAS